MGGKELMEKCKVGHTEGFIFVKGAIIMSCVFFHSFPSDSKLSQFSRTLSILVDRNNAAVWMASILPLISLPLFPGPLCQLWL